MLIYFPYFLASLVAAIIFTWAVRHFSNCHGLARAPFSSRHIHLRAIPRLGGIAVLFTFVLVLGIYIVAGQYGVTPPPICTKLLRILLASLPIVAVGIYDDLRGAGPRIKLLAEAISGAALYVSGIGLGPAEWYFSGHLVASAGGLCGTVIWVLVICNAVNLMDGLDGLAAGSALISMVTIFALAAATHQPDVSLGTAILGGALMGFLVFNFHPASIFLGDCGSLFVGFMLSSLVMAELQSRPVTVKLFLVPAISFALPLTDICWSVVRRFLSGQAVFGADREHIHHKLLDLGHSQRQVVFISYGISALCTLLSVSLIYGRNAVLFPVVCVVMLFLFFGLRRLGYHEFAEVHRVWRRASQQKESCARNIAVRKVAAKFNQLQSVDQLLDSLEACLVGDFDGFEITLDRDFATCAGNVFLHKNFFRTFRTFTRTEKIALVLELSTPSSGVIGQLSLCRQVERATLIDIDLLFGEFRRSVAIALENCSRSTGREFPVSRAHERTLARASVSGG